MKNGFTLIELLAVVVVISLLAIISSSVVTTAVKNSKDKLYETQIKNIKLAAATWGSENLNLLPEPSSCKYFTIGDLKKSGLLDEKLLDPRTNTNINENINIKITTRLSADGNNKIANYEINPVNINGCERAIYPTFVPGTLVYFDPTSGSPCNENTFNLSNIIAGSSTCYKWRTISVEDKVSDSKINIMLDHNITNMIPWGNSYTRFGPTRIFSNLSTVTSSWNRVSLLNYTYDTSNYVGEGDSAPNVTTYGIFRCINGTCSLPNNSNFVSNVRARIIEVEEVNDIFENSTNKKLNWSPTNLIQYYFSRSNYNLGTTEAGQGDTKLSWMIENTDYDLAYSHAGATDNVYGSNNYGYWTMSPSSSYWAYHIYGDGALYYGGLSVNTDPAEYGIRPVITISKQLLSY